MANAEKKSERGNLSCVITALLLLLVVSFVICLGITSYKPDRPVERIEPGSSSGPTFVVQLIRPRAGLPLGGILPPELFGVDAHLGFDSGTDAASFSFADGQIELNAKDWKLKLVLGRDGHVTPETEVVFELIFEDQTRTVRSRPDDPVVGAVTLIELPDSNEMNGHFNLELLHCEDAETGEPLGWPPEPLILHGSFDRLSPDDQN